MADKTPNRSGPNEEALCDNNAAVPATKCGDPEYVRQVMRAVPRMTTGWHYDKVREGWRGRYVLMNDAGQLLAARMPLGCHVVAFLSPVDAAAYAGEIASARQNPEIAGYRPVMCGEDTQIVTDHGDFAYVMTRPVVKCPKCGALTSSIDADRKAFLCEKCGTYIPAPNIH